MKTAETKTASSAHLHQSGQPFFQRNGASAFFSDSQTNLQTKSFFSNQAVQPLIQTKLSIGQPGDKYEQEADAVAQKVVSSSKPTLQTKCAECEKEESLRKQSLPEEEDLKMKPSLQLKNDATSAGRTEPSPWIQSKINNSRGSGRPLASNARIFMESRMQTDFSSVNIHTGDEAVQMNQELGARAFTLGSDIYFNKGEYRPETTDGKKLLAHELTHTYQQGAADNSALIQQMRIGRERENPPQNWVQQFNARNVPDQDLSRVEEAIDMIRNVVSNREQYSSCHQFFQENCPNGSEDSLRSTFNNAVLWKADRPSALAFANAPGTNIAYTQSGYDSGARSLAATLVHELLHNCGITGGQFHYLADVAGLYCIGNDNDFLVSMGPAIGADIIYVMISYRRLLMDLASGHIQLNAGTDINVTGIGSEIGSAISGLDLTSGEFASLTLGLRGRANIGWGGERYGGITGSLDLGLDVGRFRVSEASPEANTEISPGFVMQAGLGAEFYIPIGANAIPISINAMYRMVRPLNPQAEMIHGLLGGMGVSF